MTKFLEDLPKRHGTHDTADAAEMAFLAAIEHYKFFLVQQRDRNDYGTDIQIEARHADAMTNLRVHVQLKGTETNANTDGTVSIEVARTNLNYLLAQPDSVYVCYHLPTQRLLARHAQDVYREYEHRGTAWRQQTEVTVKFTHAFDEKFQQSLNARALASGKSARDHRLNWTAAPPDLIPAMVRQAIPAIEVPSDPQQAIEVLSNLYNTGNDTVISNSFEKFSAVLNALPGAMDMAYMAEINLGINRLPFDENRVRKGIQVLEENHQRGRSHPGTILYCQGNGWLALGEYDKAREVYDAALMQLSDPALISFAAQCSKNMGSALEGLGGRDEARAFYERALELDPDLGEAHLALGLWHLRSGENLRLALEHLDCVVRQQGSTLPMFVVQGWRLELLFKTGDIPGAFREIQVLLSSADQLDWAWPVCARHVASFGRVSVDSAQRAVRFWRSYPRNQPGGEAAKCEALFCHWYLHDAGVPTTVSFEEFRNAVVRLIEREGSEAAFLWDRVGHWAQHDNNWIEAEKAYRKAYDLEPERYGYCLGTALNFLGRYGEALPVLLREATDYTPDDMSWFQVAKAREGVSDISGSNAAYRKALEINPDYDLAWFNLGSNFWNSGDISQAAITWNEAVTRFPEHPLTKQLKTELPFLFETEKWG